MALHKTVVFRTEPNRELVRVNAKTLMDKANVKPKSRTNYRDLPRDLDEVLQSLYQNFAIDIILTRSEIKEGELSL